MLFYPCYLCGFQLYPSFGGGIIEICAIRPKKWGSVVGRSSAIKKEETCFFKKAITFAPVTTAVDDIFLKWWASERLASVSRLEPGLSGRLHPCQIDLTRRVQKLLLSRNPETCLVLDFHLKWSCKRRSVLDFYLRWKCKRRYVLDLQRRWN